MKFEDWFASNFRVPPQIGQEPPKIWECFSPADCRKAWDAGRSEYKKEVLKQLEEYSHVPAYPHIKNSLEKIS